MIISTHLEKNKKKNKKNKKKKQDEKTIDANEFNELIIKKETDINRKLFNKHFMFQSPSSMAKELYKTNDKENQTIRY